MALPVGHHEPDSAASVALLHARTYLEALPRCLVSVHRVAALPLRLVPGESHVGVHEEELPPDSKHGVQLRLHARGVDGRRHHLPGRVAVFHGTPIQGQECRSA